MSCWRLGPLAATASTPPSVTAQQPPLLEVGASGGDRLHAVVEVEELDVGASGGDRREPSVRHLHAVAEVLEVGASGGDRLDPAVRHLHAVPSWRLGHPAATASTPPSVTAPQPPRSKCWRLGHPAATNPPGVAEAEHYRQHLVGQGAQCSRNAGHPTPGQAVHLSTNAAAATAIGSDRLAWVWCECFLAGSAGRLPPGCRSAIAGHCRCSTTCVGIGVRGGRAVED